MVIGLAANPIGAEEQRSPQEILAAKGLQRQDRVWVAQDEIALRQDLAELPKRRERITQLERSLDQRIEQNRTAWQQSRAAAAILEKTLASLPTNDPQRAALQRQIETLQANVVDPARLGSKDDVRAQVVAWVAERNELAAASVRIRRKLPKLVDRYAELAEDQELQRTLRSAGDGHRLGPLRTYQGELQKLGEYERLVFTRWNPLHWQAGQARVTGLVDDRAPITFSWNEASQEPTLITATAAEAAGIDVADNAPRETVVLGRGRSVTARPVRIAYLRFGACVLRDVQALVLPPEAEDWGCRIGREAFANHTVRLEPERLRLWIDP